MHVIIERRGEGRPLLLLPGAAADATLWDEVAPMLEDAFELHMVEIAGFSGRPPVAGPLWPAAFEELAAHLESLPTPAWVMGHSWGGFVAWSLLADGEVPLRGGVILDAMPALGELISSDRAALESVVAERVAGLSRVAEGSLAGYLAPSVRAMTRSPVQARRVLDVARGTDPRTLAEAMAAAWLTDLRPRLRAAEARRRSVRLVLPGDEHLPVAERARKHSLARAQVEPLAHHRVVLVPNAGHYVMLDQPEAVATIVHDLVAL